MNVRLLFRDRDFDPHAPSPWNADALVDDLGLTTLLNAMAGGDTFLADTSRAVLLTSPGADDDTILYRQAILRDCIASPALASALYGVAVSAIEEKRQHWWGMSVRHPGSILYGALSLVEIFARKLHELRRIVDAGPAVESAGFRTLFVTLQRELDDHYLASITEHLARLRFRHGAVLGAHLGSRGDSASVILRVPPERGPHWLERVFGRPRSPLTFRIADRDESGARALSELQDRGIAAVANAVAQSADHLLSFFEALRAELAFYLACLNLHRRLSAIGVPVAFPQPLPRTDRHFGCDDLRDVSLALQSGEVGVGNDLPRREQSLIVITGANRGGKSTFLRAIGLAQLLMQAGAFVAARAFAAPVCNAITTHYRREEDASLRSGRLDEELSRMSALVDHVVPHTLLLLNESFASTNEREGSAIATEVVSSLVGHGVRVVFVTHLHEFARRLSESGQPEALFLRAERLADGTRTFRLVEGAPLGTSFGEDMFARVFSR